MNSSDSVVAYSWVYEKLNALAHNERMWLQVMNRQAVLEACLPTGDSFCNVVFECRSTMSCMSNKSQHA